MLCSAMSKYILHSPRATALRYEHLLCYYLSRLPQIKASDVNNILEQPIYEISTAHALSRETEVMQRVALAILEFPRALLNRSKMNKKLIYACICMVVVCMPLHKDLLARSQDAIQWLQATEEVDMKREIDCCNAARLSDPAKVDDRVLAPRTRTELFPHHAQSIFEVCDICGEGIGWTTFSNARCVNGHTFGTNLTFPA